MLALAGCGDSGDEDAAAPPAQTAPAASALVTRIAELEARIGEYCEFRSSGSATADQRAAARADLRALIRLAGRHPEARQGLRETAIVIDADCREPAMLRQARRALRAFRASR